MVGKWYINVSQTVVHVECGRNLGMNWGTRLYDQTPST